MAEVQQAARRATKAAKMSMVSSLCNQLESIRNGSNGDIPYGRMAKVLRDAKNLCPHMEISRHDIANFRRKLTAKRRQERAAQERQKRAVKERQERAAEDMTITAPINQESILVEHNQIQQSSCCTLGGRPKGATNILRQSTETKIVTARNEIALIFAGEKRKAKSQNKRMKKGRIQEIINEVKTKFNLPSDFTVSTKLIRYCERSGSLMVAHKKGSGQYSPLVDLEPQFLSLIIQMSRIGDPLTLLLYLMI